MIRSVLVLLLSSLLVSLASAGTTAEGIAFLAKKEQEPGVVKLPSGLLYVFALFFLFFIALMIPCCFCCRLG